MLVIIFSLFASCRNSLKNIVFYPDHNHVIVNQHGVTIPLSYMIDDARFTLNPEYKTLFDKNDHITFFTNLINLKPTLIQLDEILNTRLIEFLNGEVSNQYKSTNAATLVFHLTGQIPKISADTINPKWNQTIVTNIQDLEVGNAVIITNNANPYKILHWALYLGNDFFLSKYEDINKFVLSTSSDLLGYFEGNTLVKVFMDH